MRQNNEVTILQSCPASIFYTGLTLFIVAMTIIGVICRG